MPKRKPGQLPLDTGEPRRKGTAERNADADLRELRSAGMIGAGMAALCTAYRLTAREIDRAETEADRWGKMKASSELRAIRERLAPIAAPTATHDLLDALRTALRDTPES